MDKRKRQQRLIQKVRNLQKWLRRERVKAKRSGERFSQRDERVAHMEANHGKLCSCNMCCNPRHNEWNSKSSRLTLQERKAYEKFKASYEEYPD